MSVSSYPMHVDAHLDSGLSRWLWLVKWVLVIPHYFVLAFLWLAFLAVSVVAFFAILFTGRYPRAMFDFNVGVLRWSWRVAYYAYGALGTDRYPPFTLAEVPDYPAHLSVDYPAHLSRGLVLVKWWLLAIPHYLILALFVGGGLYWSTEVAGSENAIQWGGGLIGLLVLLAGILLLLTGRYPTALFDVVLGLNRWVLRVAAYAGLMTDEYPPFRFDAGPHEPEPGPGGGVALRTPPAGPVAPPGVLPPPAPSAASPAPPASPERMQWTTGRVLALSVGILVMLFSLGTGIGGATLALADAALRDDDGFLMTDTQPVSTSTYAVVSEDMELHTDAAPGFVPEGLLGDAKVTAGSDIGPVFVGVASAEDAAAFLAGVPHAIATDLPLDGGEAKYEAVPGTAAPGDPADADIWVESASGTGTQTVAWPLEEGTWTVVVMNADGSRGVFADVAAGVTVPGLSWLVALLLAVAGTGLVVAIVLLLVAFRPQRQAGGTL